MSDCREYKVIVIDFDGTFWKADWLRLVRLFWEETK